MSNFSRWQAGTAALLALGLTSGAVAPLVSPAPTYAQEINFPDVPSNHWAKDFITEVVKVGIMDGAAPDGTTFKPDAPVTRAQFAVILKQANSEEYWDKPYIRKSIRFSDVSSRHWAASAIDAATRTGLMRGYPGDIFRPDKSISREEVFVYLANGLGYRPTQEPSSVLSIYNDASSISDYARTAIAAATQNKLVVNYPNVAKLDPNRSATRAEIAAAIYQAMVREGKAPAINSPYIVTPKPAATNR